MPVTAEAGAAAPQAEIQSPTEFSMLVDKIADVDLRDKLKESFAQLSTRHNEIAAEAEITDAKLKRLQAKADIVNTFTTREKIATGIGALLLLVFGVTFVLSAFMSWYVNPVISQTFSLILGYFFGQTTTKVVG